MSKKDDTFEMLDDVPEAPKKTIVVLVMVLLLITGGLSFFLLKQPAKQEMSVSTTVEPTPEIVLPAATQPSPTLSAVVYFDEASATINPDQMETLRAFYQQIKDSAGTLQLDGYTDNYGSEQEDFVLSKNRAEAVAEVLKSMDGVSKIVFEVESFGRTNPIGDNNTAQGRQQNRRVELKFSPSS